MLLAMQWQDGQHSSHAQSASKVLSMSRAAAAAAAAAAG
jgi:hypothetical protein